MRVSRNHKLSRMAVWNTMLLAEFIRQPVSLDAMPRFQRVLWIVDPGVDDSAIALTGRHPQLGFLLHEKNILPPDGNGSRDRAADHSTADNQNVGLIHKSILSASAIHGH
jgi:hypothetical protein